jgi:helix-turn-helix protein
MTDKHSFLTALQLAEHLHVTPATVLAWARRGWIPRLRAGRRPVLFDLGEVEQALRTRGESPRDESDR